MRNRIVAVLAGLAAPFCATVNPLQAGSLPNLLTINPSVVGFPATGVGATSQLYSGFTIFNPGSAPVTIVGFTIKGAQPGDFTVAPGSCPLSPYSLAPGQYCYLSASFTPSAVGLRLATLVVQVGGGASQSALLTGEGLATAITVKFSIPEVSFPATPVGAPPQDAPLAFLQVQNTGNSPVNVQSASITGADKQDFQIETNGCGSSIPAGGSCYLYLTFLPAAAGMRTASLRLVDNAQGGAQTLQLLGVGLAAVNSLDFFPTAVAFAPTGTSNSVPSQINVQNNGTEPVTLDAFSITGPNASDFSIVQNGCQPVPYTLQVLGECTLDVQFTPAALGARQASLQITDTAPGSPQIVPLEGTGVGSAIQLSFSQSPIAFVVTYLGQTNYASLNVENLGPGIAQLSYQIQGIDATDFNVSNLCPVLDPYASCYLGLTFTPGAAGLRVATLVVTDSVLGQSQSVLLIGSGQPAGSSLYSGAATFQPVAVGSTSQTTLTIYSQAQSPVTISQFSLGGGAASDFGVVENGCGTGTVLSQPDYCQISLSFTPSAAGPRIATITIGYAGELSPMTVPLAGLGLSPARTISFGTEQLIFTAGPVGAPEQQYIGIANSGSEAVTIGSVSLGGTNPGDFAIIGDECPHTPATLSPGTSCQVNVQLTPAAVGTRLGLLQVADNAAGSPQSLPLVGFGVDSSAALYVSPAVLNFASQPLGSSVQEDISLQNASSIPISLTGIQIIGTNAGDFSLVNDCPATLTSYCNLYVTFTPSVTGVRFAELQIQDNAAGAPQIIPLSGLGAAVTPPAGLITLTPNPLTFPQAQGIGYTASMQITVTNNGTANVLLTGFQVIGKAAKDFGIQQNNCPLSPAPLPPNVSCSVIIEFTPSVTGNRIATFKLTDNAPGSPQSVAIVGEGVAAVKALSVSPSSAAFYPTPVGSTDYDGALVFVENTGTVPVAVSSFSFGGTDPNDFSIEFNYCGLTINPGVTCQIGLNFTPLAAGARSATFTVGSDATPGTQSVQLTGTGE